MTIKDSLTPRSKTIFYRRLFISMGVVFSLLVISLGVGMWGYSHFEHMSWVDAYVNAAMILSGMGPVDPLHTENGKIFAGSYAIYSGVTFLVAIAVVVAPILHHVLHKFHMDSIDKK